MFQCQPKLCDVKFFEYYLIHNIGSSAYRQTEKFNTFGFVQEKKERMSFHDTLKLLAKCLPNLPNSISCSFMSIA